MIKDIKSLHGKLIISGGIAVAFVLVVFSYLYIIEQNNRLINFHTEVFSRHTQSISESFAKEMARGGMDSVEHIIINEADDPDIADIKLLNSNGDIIIAASGLRGKWNYSTAFLDSVFQNESRYLHQERDLFAIVKAIGNTPQCYRCHPSSDKILGYLEVTFRFDPREMNYTGFIGLIVGIGIFFIILLSVSLWYLQHRFVRKPIGSLEYAIRQAMDGDLSVQADISGNDEIAHLSRSFNKLIFRLDNAQRELKIIYDQEMEKAERLATAGELASGIAHEIKNPLAGIVSTLHVMLEKTPESSDDREILVEMSNQVGRIEKAVKDLLSYACPPLPEFKRQAINENILHCISFVTPLADRQDVQIIPGLDEDIPSLLLDSGLFDQVLLNILMNALQAINGEGNIAITSGYILDEQSVRVCIIDNGPGIPEEMRKQIFRPFFTTKHKGSGLGLSICKKNIERHLGSIDVESKPGKGTKFIITLPVNITFDQLMDHRENL